MIVPPGVTRRDKEALTAGSGSEEADVLCVPRHLSILETSRDKKRTESTRGKANLIVGAQGQHFVRAEHVQRQNWHGLW